MSSLELTLNTSPDLQDQKRKADKKRKFKKSLKQDLIGWSLGGLPFIGGSILLGLFPKIMGYILPFFKIQGTNLKTMEFVGLDNFVYLFTIAQMQIHLML